MDNGKKFIKEYIEARGGKVFFASSTSAFFSSSVKASLPTKPTTPSRVF